MPSVVLVTERFRVLAEGVLSARGVGTEPMVLLPPTERTEYGSAEEKAAIAEAALAESLARIAPGSLDVRGAASAAAAD